MNRDELLRQIDEWHEKNEHKRIINAIEFLPREEWGYELTCLLARAYINKNMFSDDCLEKAVSLLESVREEGKNDPLWNYRLGSALVFLCRIEEALPYFRRAAELKPDFTDALKFIEECEEAIKDEEENRESERNEAELKEKALELAERLNNLGIEEFEDLEILGKYDFENVVLVILQGLKSQYPHTKIKQRMKSVHYANGFADKAFQNCAFMLDDIEEYLTSNKFMDHDESVRYFNKRITTKGFDINPKSLVLTMLDSLLFGISGGVKNRG